MAGLPTGNRLGLNARLLGQFRLPETEHFASETKLRAANELDISEDRNDRSPFQLAELLKRNEGRAVKRSVT